ncbi:MAG: hypothetical protein ABH823_03930 [bacterium]
MTERIDQEGFRAIIRYFKNPGNHLPDAKDPEDKHVSRAELTSAVGKISPEADKFLRALIFNPGAYEALSRIQNEGIFDWEILNDDQVSMRDLETTHRGTPDNPEDEADARELLKRIRILRPLLAAPQPAPPPADPNICSPAGCTIGEQPGILIVHHRSAVPDTDVMTDFVARFKQDIDGELKFIDFESGLTIVLQWVKTAATQGAVLVIKIEPFKGKKFPSDKTDYVRLTNEGTFDHMWRIIGQAVRKIGYPIMATVFHEMNMEYPSRVYPWAIGAVEVTTTGRSQAQIEAAREAAIVAKAQEVMKAWVRVRCVMGDKEFVDPDTGERVEGGGANNITWALNYDARYYAILTPEKRRAAIRKHGSFSKYIASRLRLCLPKDHRTNPEKPLFEKVWFDFYINIHNVSDITLPANTGPAPDVIDNHTDDFLAALDMIPELAAVRKGIGEVGVSLAPSLIPNHAARKAELWEAILAKIDEYNAAARAAGRQPIEMLVAFDVNKAFDPTDTGFWGISDPVDKPAGDVIEGWFTANPGLFQDRVIFHDDDNPSVKREFAPLGQAYTPSLIAAQPQQVPAPLRPDDVPVPPPVDQHFGTWSERLGKPILTRDRVEEHMGAKLDVVIAALLQLDPEQPVDFSTFSALDDYAEIEALWQYDLIHSRGTDDISLHEFFNHPETYWESAVTFLSVYSQKAVEEQDKDKAKIGIEVCLLLLARLEKQKITERRTEGICYIYPTSPHNVASIRLILADLRSQLKTLSEQEYTDSIADCLTAIEQFRELQGTGPQPAGADYFSVTKAVITIADLKVRIAQIRIRTAQEHSMQSRKKGDAHFLEAAKYFAQANDLFREAEDYYKAVAALDLSDFNPDNPGLNPGQGLKLEAEPLPGQKLSLDISVEQMRGSWANNSAKGYISVADRKKGGQGVFHFLKALATIKIQGIFLENPSKKKEDYEITGLFYRLSQLQLAMAELEHDPYLEIDFLQGLANIIRVNLIMMVADQAQYDTIQLDRASARDYFNKLLDRLRAAIPELAPEIDKLRVELIEEEAYVKQKSRGTRDAVEFLYELHAQVVATNPSLAATISRVRTQVAAGRLKKGIRPSERVTTIDDELMVDPELTPFAHTAAAAKRFALIMIQLSTRLVEQAYDHSKPLPGQTRARFPYLFMISNLALVDMKVRTFYVTERPFTPSAELAYVEAARDPENMKPDEHWYRFQALFLEGNLLMLESLTKNYRRAIPILEHALVELKKFIHPSQVFYQAQIYILLAQAHNFLGKKNPAHRQEAGKVIKKLTKLIPEILKVESEIGWNLKDFWVRYSRVLIHHISSDASITGYKPFE